MPEQLQPPLNQTAAENADDDLDTLRVLSRSPHPYHRQSFELLEPSDCLIPSHEPFPSLGKDSTPPSDSGTEADDEHFLKGLPAPKVRLHKGLRGKNEPLSGTSTPWLSPAVLEEEGRKTALGINHGEKRVAAERVRRRKEVTRRIAEVLLLGFQGGIVVLNPDAQPYVRIYGKKVLAVIAMLLGLAALYPLRLALWAYRRDTPSKALPIRVPATFDPAPLLYPFITPVLISFLVAQNVKGVVLPNLVLGIAALPRALFPGSRYWESLSSSHWLFSCTPLFLDRLMATTPGSQQGEMSAEVLVLLYPLHQTLCLILHHLTTTSLLVAELQLLSVALINLLLLATSPQAVILQAVLWGGGIGLMVLSGHVIQWGISLARVPKWRFKRSEIPSKGGFGFGQLKRMLSSPNARRQRSSTGEFTYTFSDSAQSTDRELTTKPTTLRADSFSENEVVPPPTPDAPSSAVKLSFAEPSASQSVPRRRTLPSTGKPGPRSKSSTPSGRRKRSASSSVRAFFSLTHKQATLRKWMYSSYVLTSIILIIFLGIRTYVQYYALDGNEPIGWALGYLFGGLSQFRFQVVQHDLEKWICLPFRLEPSDVQCSSGWIQHLRQFSFGEANTRLILSGYWLTIIAFGLAIVFSLSPVCEVDTRRKVFHFMMVAMFLPTIYIDPTYIALALSLMLAIFLLLDLIRASQLPPLSGPIAKFLTPYVDGRDLRGPVVISHIFLLIGCAIPLWLSLAGLGREGEGYVRGWEVRERELAMVSGVVCVGLGDAAASLIGRRWGHRKWLWGGGKSIEGSVAFAGAVFLGLGVGGGWLRLGGWETVTTGGGGGDGGGGHESLMGVLDVGRLYREWGREKAPRMGVCSVLASLTEAVLTGGNDNVVVPVVLWGCVRGLEI
ncbi:dolichol kinase [Podospora pseudocomata]|uniref:dolichol kinase n=1 Tax=Podospora pseudocomata TaxID=2093779 RepID=A0ABR0GNG3_9PEZI|nr:dolichol kinase [Podospora pseudocomata]